MDKTPVFTSLNPQQQRFVTEYLKSNKVFESYVAAGYKLKGNSGRVAATRLLKNQKVQSAIQEIQTDYAEVCKTEIQQALEQALACALYDPKQLNKKINKWPEKTIKSISSSSVIDGKVSHYFERHKYLKLILELQQNKKPDKADIEHQAREIHHMMHEFAVQAENTIPVESSPPPKFLPNGVTPWPSSSNAT